MQAARHLLRSAALAALLPVAPASVVACGASRDARSPQSVLSEYAHALGQGRVKDAYDLLSDDAQKSMPFEAFERMVKENPEEMKAIAQALLRPSGTAAVTAVVTGSDGQTLLLRLEGDRWRVDRSAVDIYSQETPDGALRSFVRAFRNKRYDVLLRFVPDAKREGLDAAKLKTAFEGEQKEEALRLTQAIEAALPTTTVEDLGDRATMSYGAAGTVELVREHGTWRIEDF